MLTVGELLRLLNKYQAQHGLSPDAVVRVEIFNGDHTYGVYPATMVSCHVENQEATIYASRNDQTDELEEE